MTTIKLSNMSVMQLQNYLKNYKEKNGFVPYELKKEIEFQIEKEKINNQIFAKHLIKSKWFKLGIAQTIKKGQATRILIGQNIIHHLDSYDIISNLIELTFKATHKTNFNFIERLKKI